MSITLKRPMFRRGGKVNTGIMTGLVDREQYSTGTDKIGRFTEDEFKSNLETLMGVQDQFAPVAKTRLPLGEVGLALASGAPIVDALGVGYKKFVSEDDKRRALLDKRKQAAVSTVLGQALKDKKEKDFFITLSPEQAKNELKGAYREGVLYQKNLTTGKVDAKSLGPAQVIKEQKDPNVEYQIERAKEAATSDTKRIADAETNYFRANKVDQTIKVLNVLADTSDEELRTGTLGPLRLSATKLLNELGVDVDFQNVPLAEVLNAVGGKVAVEALQGFKGAISNKELQFVIDRNPGLQTSKPGIKLQLELLERANNISKKYYTEVISPFVDKNQGLRGTLNGKTFNQLQKEFYEANPYMTDEIKDRIASVQDNLDPEYSKNIVIRNGIRYLVNPKTKEIQILPSPE
jgi:hypothetical protein